MFIDDGKRLTIQKIINDVATVKKHAQYLIVLKNGLTNCIFNPNGELRVIAIIGPSDSPFGDLEEVVLCEIGFGRIRPYSTAERPKNNSCTHEIKTIKYRRKVFFLSKLQYENVAFCVFSLMQDIANKRISSWKCGPHNPFILKSSKSNWSKRRKNFFLKNVTHQMNNGVHFTFSKRDEYFIQDIHWAEFFGNKQLEKQLDGLAKIITFPLRHYRRLKTRKPLEKLSRYADIKNIFDTVKLPSYLFAETMLRINEKDMAYFREDLKKLINFSIITDEKKLALSAISDPEKRLGGIQLRLTHKHANMSVRVVEVFHSIDTSYAFTEQISDDAIPF